jgi:multiple sugar transport system substrate-binding protein
LYRADLVAEKGLPQQWEDVAAWAEAYHNPPQRYGLVLSVEGVLGHCLFLSMMAGLGHPPYLDPDKPALDRAAAEYVLVELKNLIRFTPPGSTRWGPWDIFEHMSQQSDVGYSPSIFAYVNYFEGMPYSRSLRLTTVPSFAGRGVARPILGGVGLGITSSGQHRQVAADYGQFLTSEPVQRIVFPASSGQPAAKVAWEDPELNRRFNGFYVALAKNMKTAYIRPRYPAFHAIELRNGAVLQQWWENRLPLDEVLAQLVEVSPLARRS